MRNLRFPNRGETGPFSHSPLQHSRSTERPLPLSRSSNALAVSRPLPDAAWPHALATAVVIPPRPILHQSPLALTPQSFTFFRTSRRSRSRSCSPPRRDSGYHRSYSRDLNPRGHESGKDRFRPTENQAIVNDVAAVGSRPLPHTDSTMHRFRQFRALSVMDRLAAMLQSKQFRSHYPATKITTKMLHTVDFFGRPPGLLPTF